jgi:hypothetical protein
MTYGESASEVSKGMEKKGYHIPLDLACGTNPKEPSAGVPELLAFLVASVHTPPLADWRMAPFLTSHLL